ncbi:hypothetical protein [Micromonospora sp. NPDC005652]|uniref:hypothetical protein n=1 Tax=Micromonospora sp. NPDC005652 TaxID=3157046 RepID=UPI0033DC566D
MPRIQVLWLPPRPDGSTPFALVVDRAGPDGAGERDDAIYEFGRDVGASGVLVTADTIELPESLEVAEDPAPVPRVTPVHTFAPLESLGAQVARMIRTQAQTRERPGRA